ncbi:hypothetical protein [Deminuibacter soli]|uniref:Phospholipase/carboxylesterase/thioesterase domain-containing protein n=1 Tax=Deminuibacter soli TaxID=2291815 RepID=A0A3E1NGZ6_9BACT|nr:hypothetical protein [Deminuibacter soli]RFM27124.1 hypothetical protein DXN05_16810 [Deminuibacter soli]
MRTFLALVVLLQVNTLLAANGMPTVHCTKGFRYIDTVLNAGGDQRFIPVLVAFMHPDANPAGVIAAYSALAQPVHLVIPFGNCNSSNGNTYFTGNGSDTKGLVCTRTMQHTLDSIAGFIHTINRQYHCRSFVSGYQQGGELAVMLSVYYPEKIAGAFPIAFSQTNRLNMLLKKTHAGFMPVYLYRRATIELAATGSENEQGHNIYLAVNENNTAPVAAEAWQSCLAMLDVQLQRYRNGFSEKRLNKYYPVTADNRNTAPAKEARVAANAGTTERRLNELR